MIKAYAGGYVTIDGEKFAGWVIRRKGTRLLAGVNGWTRGIVPGETILLGCEVGAEDYYLDYIAGTGIKCEIVRLDLQGREV